MEANSAAQLIEKLQTIYAYVVVVKSAPAVGRFSTVPGHISYEKVSDKISVGELFRIEPAVLEGRGTTHHQRAAKRLMDVLRDREKILSVPQRIAEVATEKLSFISIADLILKRLTSTVTLNKCEFGDKLLQEHGVVLQTDFIGMGTTLTLHGAPDARADWVPLSAWPERRALNDSDDDSLGGKVAVEAKHVMRPQHRDQLVAQAIASSFIHKKRHPSQNPLIPSVGIIAVDGEMAAMLYDCESDILLEISRVKWLNLEDVSNATLEPSGVLLM